MNRAILLVVCLVMFSFIATAEAHFYLNSPAATLTQATDGTPQKTPPCGGAGTATNVVTAVQSGAMLSISITQTIQHPGYYRVFLAQDISGLPADPPLNATDANCYGLAPVSNPTLPLLADGLLMHTTPFNPTTQTMQVPIPTGMTCTNCILQVVEYMQNHQPGCYYHHCATVNISPDAPPQTDAPAAGGDAGVDGGGGSGTGCCSASGGSSATAGLGVLVVGLALRRRRR